jgi:hypothetical protein
MHSIHRIPIVKYERHEIKLPGGARGNITDFICSTDFHKT